MRRVRVLLGLLGVAGLACTGQGMSDFAAAATGSTAGAAAGKPLSDSVTKIFGNTGKAAEKEKSPVLRADSGHPQVLAQGDVPAPGRSRSSRGAKKSSPPAEPQGPPVIDSLFGAPVLPEADVPQNTLANAIPNPAPLPPPEMTPESLGRVVMGMSRTDLLHLGPPASKITMDEDGHLVEIFTYTQDGARVGTVRLQDGAVAGIRR